MVVPEVLARVLLALLVALVAAVVAPAAQAARIGAVTDLTWGISETEATQTIDLLQSTGVRTVRMNVNWKEVEPHAKGSMDAGVLARTDALVDRLAAAGIEVLMPISDGVPYWASADPAKRTTGTTRSWDGLYRPADVRDYADFAAFVARRYSARGVHHFEVWNEPNHPRFWPSGVDAGQYAALLRAAYPAIKAADPRSTVVLGGLSKSDATYLDALYAAGAKDLFDVAAVHPYTGSVDPSWCWSLPDSSTPAPDAFCGLDEVRRVMQRHGDGETPVWLTEFGWSTATDAPYSVTEAQQAQFLTTATEALAASYPWVQRAYWYGLRNVSWLRDTLDDLEAGYGVVRTDFAPKPALARLTAAVADGEGPAPAPAPAPVPAPGATRPAPTAGTAPAPTPAPTPAPAPAPAPAVTDVPPTGYRVTDGKPVKGRRGVKRLARRDGRAVELRAATSRAPRAGLEVRARLAVAVRRDATALGVVFHGSTSTRTAVRLRVYDVVARRWRTTTAGASLRPVRRFLTRAGTVRVRATASGRRGLRLRADQVRLRVTLGS